MNRREKTVSCLAAAVLSLALVNGGLAQAIEPKPPLATKGTINANYDDLRAHHRLLNDTAFTAILRSPEDVFKTLEDTLIPRYFAQTSEKLRPKNEYEASIARQMTDRASLDIQLAITDARTRDRMTGEQAQLLARARELYAATDPPKSQLSAHFQHVFFDLSKRPFAETSQRVTDALAALERGDSFDDVALRFSDEASVAQNRGVLLDVPSSDMDSTLARTLFERLKEGQWAQPIVSRRGIHIVKLLQKIQPAKLPFAQVQAEFIARAEAEQINAARETVLRPIRETKTTLNDVELKKILIVPDPEVVKNARKIVEDQARKAADQQAQPKEMPTK